MKPYVGKEKSGARMWFMFDGTDYTWFGSHPEALKFANHFAAIRSFNIGWRRRGL